MDSERTPETSNPVRTYAVIFLALALITLVELLLSSSQVNLARSLLNTVFILFSLGKAALVAAFYMHLRSDNRLYMAIFLVPVALLLAFAALVIIR